MNVLQIKSSKLSLKNYLVLVYIVLQIFKSNLKTEHWKYMLIYCLSTTQPKFIETTKTFWYPTVDMILDAQALFYSHGNSPSGGEKDQMNM